MTTSPTQSLSAITTDLYCASCAYNMRGQSVFIEPTTRLQVIRCPECGAYHPIQLLGTTRRWHLWADKALMLFSILWAAGITCVSLAALFFEYVSSVAIISIASGADYNTEEYFIATFFLVVSPIANAILISAAITSPGIKRRLAIAAVRWGFFTFALWVTFAAFSFSSSYHDEILSPLLLLPIAVHAILSLIGVLLGQPIALFLCRSFVPKSLHPHVLSYWGLPPDPDPSTPSTSSSSAAHGG